MTTAGASKDGHRRSSPSISSPSTLQRSAKRPRPATTTRSFTSPHQQSHHVSIQNSLRKQNARPTREPVAPQPPPEITRTHNVGAKQSDASSNKRAISKLPTPRSATLVPKRRFTRSRAGCSTCRTRKIKCDEERPHCRRCLEDGRTCQGYGQEQQQRPKPSKEMLSPSQSSSLLSALPPALSLSHLPTDAADHQETTTWHGFRSTNVMEAVTSHCPLPTTSPRHLDDWLDLLCSSIANDIPQPSSGTATDSIKVQSDLAHDDKQGTLQSQAQAQHAASSESQKSTPSQGAHSSPHSGLSALASAAAGVHPVPAHLDSPAWLNEEWLSILTASPADSLDNLGHHTASSPPVATRSALPALERISESDLQRRIRALCVTKVQLESVSFFFNETARCFHLLSADTNVWRIFFAQLASESPVILDLVACLGLTHLSLAQDPRKKGLAHAHFSRCKTEWDSSVGTLDSPNAILHAAERITTAHRVLELLAGTILIAHVEQFSRGFATSSRAYTALAITVIRKALSSKSGLWLSELDQGPGSAFRFFVRILLWWETMSRTMGPASEQGDMSDIFQHVFRWEELGDPGQDPIGCSMQCVVGWPLDLLEAVERTTRVSRDPEILAFQPPIATSPPLVMPAASLSHILEGSISLQLQQQVDAIETQIRLARPSSLVQDDSIAAELRYLIFECLQSASLVYLCRTILKSTDAVWFEVDKVTRFLERKQQRTDQANPAHASRFVTASSTGISNADLQLAQAMEARGKWWIRAPDGALIWAYFQCASEIFGTLDPSAEILPCSKTLPERIQIGSGDSVPLALGSQLTLGSDVYCAFAQSRTERRQRCRRSLLLWERFDETQCIFLCRHLIKAIWDRRDLYEQQHLHSAEKGASETGTDPPKAPYDQVSELKDICRQRRWKQPLIF